MEINRELIIKVAKNARINLTEEEIKEFIPQFKEILENFSKLKEVDTAGVKVSIQPIDIKNVIRKDEIKECVSNEDILKNTEHKKDKYFLGPKAL